MKDYLLDLICARHGWKAWPANATKEERSAALDALISGKEYAMYPPSYTQPKVDTSGKLKEKERDFGANNDSIASRWFRRG